MSGVLNHSPAQIVRQLLIDLGLAVAPSYTSAGAYNGSPWPVFYSNEPDSPDSSVTVYNKVGQQHGRTQDDGETQEHHGIQVRVRSAEHDPGYLKAKAVHDGFDADVAYTEVTLGSDVYMVEAITNTSDVLSIGYEVGTSRRRLFTVNALLSVTLVS